MNSKLLTFNMSSLTNGLFVPAFGSRIVINNNLNSKMVSPQANEVISVLGQSIKDGVASRIQGATGLDSGLVDLVVDYATSVASEQVKNLIGNNGNQSTGFDGSSGNPPIIVGVNPNERFSSASRDGRIDYNPNPVEIELNTGIPVNSYTSIYQDSVPGAFTPLGINIGRLSFLNNTADYVSSFFNNVAGGQFITVVQRNISYQLPSGFTVSNLINYFDSLANALQIFYFWDSILTYTNSSANRNPGLQYIRQYSISATTIANLNNLKWILSGTPIPPNLRLFCSWLMQNFTNGELPNSPIIRFCPVAMKTSPIGSGFYVPDDSSIATIIATLQSYNYITNVLASAFPAWINNEMPGSLSSTVHDSNFSNIWSNSPYLYRTNSAAAYVITPTVVNASIPVTYSCFTSNPDGAALALCSIFNSQSGIFEPSLLNTFGSGDGSTFQSNHFHYVNSGVSQLGLKVTITDFNGASCLGRTNLAINGGPNSQIATGAEPLLGVSCTTVTQTVYQMMEWLFGFGTYSFTPNSLKTPSKPYKRRGRK